MIATTITVGSTAVRLVGSGAVVAAGQKVLIKNTHASDKLIIGGSNVAANNGFGIDAGQISISATSNPVMSSGRSAADPTTSTPRCS